MGTMFGRKKHTAAEGFLGAGATGDPVADLSAKLEYLRSLVADTKQHGHTWERLAPGVRGDYAKWAALVSNLEEQIEKGEVLLHRLVSTLGRN
jgi:hypothetical protein